MAKANVKKENVKEDTAKEEVVEKDTKVESATKETTTQKPQKDTSSDANPDEIKIKSSVVKGNLINVLGENIKFDEKGFATVNAEQAAYLLKIPTYKKA